jgi:hypothetical protein
VERQWHDSIDPENDLIKPARKVSITDAVNAARRHRVCLPQDRGGLALDDNDAAKSGA